MGDGRVTILDVAERAGVSISSVSAALNDKPGVSETTRDKIRAVAAELGFIPSIRGRSLSGKRAFAAGLVVQRSTEVLESDPFFASFISGIESVLGVRGYALVLQMAGDSAEALRHYRQLVGGRRVDGVFLNELEIDDSRIPLIQELGIPAVAVNADVGPFRVPVVRQDYVEGIGQLVNYLAGMGHRQIAHLAGPPQFVHSRQRESAWRAAMTALGLEPGLVVAGDFTFEGGARAAESIYGGAHRPTAVVCANDLMAAGFLARTLDLGLRVPDDISIAGYDGIPLGEYVRPRLTTLRTTPHLLAEEAARMLLGWIESGDRVADVEIAPARLEIRESTGAVPAAR